MNNGNAVGWIIGIIIILIIIFGGWWLISQQNAGSIPVVTPTGTVPSTQGASTTGTGSASGTSL